MTKHSLIYSSAASRFYWENINSTLSSHHLNFSACVCVAFISLSYSGIRNKNAKRSLAMQFICSTFDTPVRNAIEGLLSGKFQTVREAAVACRVGHSRLQDCVTSYISELKRLGMTSKAGYLARLLAEHANLTHAPLLCNRGHVSIQMPVLVEGKLSWGLPRTRFSS